MTALLAAAWAATAQAQAPLSPAKPYGVLLLCPDAGKDWSVAVSSLTKALGKEVPLADAVAPDAKAMQKAVDGLEARRVKKIVAVPLFLSSYSAEMDQIRYLLGIRKDPPSAYFNTAHRHEGSAVVKRVKLKTPVVLASALDDHALLSDALSERAKRKTKKPETESLVLIADAPAGDLKNSQWLGAVNSVAEMARRKANMARVKTLFIPQDAAQRDRDKAFDELRRQLRSLKAQGPVVALPFALSASDVPLDVPKALSDTLIQYDPAPLLGDWRLSAWVVESAQKASALPDMRNFKDAGRAMPKPSPFHRLGGRP